METPTGGDKTNPLSQTKNLKSWDNVSKVLGSDRNSIRKKLKGKLPLLQLGLSSEYIDNWGEYLKKRTNFDVNGVLRQLRRRKEELIVSYKIVKHRRQCCLQELEEIKQNMEMLMSIYQQKGDVHLFCHLEEDLLIKATVKHPVSLVYLKDATGKFRRFDMERVLEPLEELRQRYLDYEESINKIDNLLENLRTKISTVKTNSTNLVNWKVSQQIEQTVNELAAKTETKKTRGQKCSTFRRWLKSRKLFCIVLILVEIGAIILFAYLLIF